MELIVKGINPVINPTPKEIEKRVILKSKDFVLLASSCNCNSTIIGCNSKVACLYPS